MLRGPPCWADWARVLETRKNNTENAVGLVE